MEAQDVEELVKAILENGAVRDFDYVIGIAPIIISGVAIGISIFTARKQNHIVLFEKKIEVYKAVLDLIKSYEYFSELEKVLQNEEYTPCSEGNREQYYPWNCMRCFSLCLQGIFGAHISLDASNFFETEESIVRKQEISNILDSSVFLFDKSISTKIIHLKNVVINEVENLPYKNFQNDNLLEIILDCKNNVLPKIEKQLKL